VVADGANRTAWRREGTVLLVVDREDASDAEDQESHGAALLGVRLNYFAA
jgi:hypothetical protein